MSGVHRLSLALCLAFAACATPPPAGTLLFPDEAHAQAAAGTRTLIDVRQPREIRDPRFAANVGAWLPFDRATPAAFVGAVATRQGHDREKPIALICEVGERAAFARAALQDAGFTDVASVDQGYVGWRAEALPLQPRPTP